MIILCTSLFSRLYPQMGAGAAGVAGLVGMTACVMITMITDELIAAAVLVVMS